MRIYRNTATDPTDFHMVSEVPYDPANPTQNTSFTDDVSDAVLAGTAPGMTAARRTLDMNGPRATSNTLLTNVLSTDATGTHNLFQVGTLSFTASKGGNTLSTKTFQITSSSTLGQLITFMQQATGIHVSDPTNNIPNDSSGAPAGASVTGDPINGGRIQIVSNNGTNSAVDIGLSALQLTTASGTSQVNLNFNTTQQAVGSGAVADFVVYDSLGVAVNVRVTAELQSQNSTQTVYRWYADSPDNQPINGVDIGAGTGLIAFDGQGKLISASGTTVSVSRSNSPAVSPLDFNLDFSGLSGLAAASSSLAATEQDGFPPGKLTSYNIADDGTIKGVFDNGTQRDLGQLQLARFANPAGLVQEGQNLFSAGVNSGLPVLGSANSEGMGSIVSGAVELSNTDISKSLIELITASTMYRGNAQVISAANQLLQDLLNLGR
jgi:flagellar hook protein FlgE